MSDRGSFFGYSGSVKILETLTFAALLVFLPTDFGQVPPTPHYDAKHLPRFEDFAVTEVWKSPPAPVKLTTASKANVQDEDNRGIQGTAKLRWTRQNGVLGMWLKLLVWVP